MSMHYECFMVALLWRKVGYRWLKLTLSDLFNALWIFVGTCGLYMHFNVLLVLRLASRF